MGHKVWYKERVNEKTYTNYFLGAKQILSYIPWGL